MYNVCRPRGRGLRKAKKYAEIIHECILILLIGKFQT
jgi:hypothetical protein